MSRLGRRFDMYVVGAQDVERLCAWKTEREVSFTQEQARQLRRVRKRNTFLFDTLCDLCGRDYRVSRGVMEDVLYEAVMVDFRMSGHVRCLKPDDPSKPTILPAKRLERTLYENGFYIRNVQGRDVHFVPFVASASMSREDEYLFVNEERLDGLLRAASLDMVSAVRGMPVLNGLPLGEENGGGSGFGGLLPEANVASVPKLAAYLGLALSDGVSLRETWAAKNRGAVPAQEDKAAWLLGMNEHNTVCMADWNDAPTGLDAFDYCWVNEQMPRRAASFPGRYSGRQTEGQKALQALFLALREGKAEFREALGREGMEQHWHGAIDSFFAHDLPAPLKEGPVPQLHDSPQGVSIYHAAALYAACLLMDEGEAYLAADETAPCQGRILTATDLQAAVTRLMQEEALQSRLWNLLHEEKSAMQHLLQTDTAEGYLQVKLRRSPGVCYQAALRRIDSANRFARGNLYDGCGFMDDVLFDQLEEALRGGPRPAGVEPLNAVQIRLPWCKGLLVRFTASAFFRRWVTERGWPARDVCIVDAFGCCRPLLDSEGNALVKVFFTESMFKGAGWFRRLERQDGGMGDCWAEYWRRLRLHDASLLIAGRSTAPGMTSRLNYQFLTTLGLKPDEVQLLAERRLRELREALDRVPVTRCGVTLDGVYRMAELLTSVTAPDAALEAAEQGMAEDAREEQQSAGDADGETPEEAGKDAEGVEDTVQEGPAKARGGSYAACLGRALLERPDALLDSSLIRDRFRGLVRSDVLQMMRGRMPVAGDVRYLLPDLLQMARYMAGRFLVWGESGNGIRRRKGWDERVHGPKMADVAGGAENSAINSLTGGQPFGCYYAPGRETPWVQKSREPGGTDAHLPVVMLRNPHYAMGEAPVLEPLAAGVRGVYDHWFGHLTGCVMASAAAMFTVNGADCDGDRVNLCAEGMVLRAVRRRALRENALLARVIARQTEMSAWLQAQADRQRKDSRARQYLHQLARKLPEILPAWPREGVKTYRFCRPLIYAGSAAKGHVFSRSSLQAHHLRDKLWDAFCLSRKQRIGHMSLQVLKLAANAYGEENTDVSALDDGQLTARFLARYLVVSSALDTAMEIDMAKTGAERMDNPLKAVPQDVCSLLGLGGRSGFYLWRRKYAEKERQLKGYGFDAALEKLMAEYARECRAEEASPLTLDLLPGIVYRIWAPERAGEKRSENAEKVGREEKKALPERLWLQESGLSGRAVHTLRSCLLTPDAQRTAMLKKTDGLGRTVLSRLQQCLQSYDMKRRLAVRVQRAETALAPAWQAMMRWLLNNGFCLNDAQAAMDVLQGVVMRWHSKRLPGMMLVGDVFIRLREMARSQETAVAWGWAWTPGEREPLLQAMLQGALQPARSCEGMLMSFTAREKQLLTCTRRSIVLVRLLAEYGEAAAQVLERTALGSGMTMDELEDEMRRILLDGCGAEDDALFYAACHALRNARYTDDSGSIHQLMSDFLLTYLLREQLEEITGTPAEKAAQTDGDNEEEEKETCNCDKA